MFHESAPFFERSVLGLTDFFAENIGTIVICIILIVIVALIIKSLIKDKKAGRNSCGCKCAGCANAGTCCSAGNSGMKRQGK